MESIILLATLKLHDPDGDDNKYCLEIANKY